MGPLPLDPVIAPRIELNRNPPVYIVRDEDWLCPDCQDHYALDEEGKERVCIVCAIKKSGKVTIMLFGWSITKATNQLIFRPPIHRVDGS